ncbi:TraB/GumN family protein [Pseudomonadota bacterium]
MHKKSKNFLHQAISIWLIALMLMVGNTFAGTETPFAYGLLFHIEKPGTPPSHLFGTMHSEEPQVLSLPEPVKNAFDNADTLALELKLEPAALQTSMLGMLLQDERELSDIIGPQLYKETITATTENGIPENAIKKFKPWGVIMLLSMPPVRTGQFLDLTLYQSATAQGKILKGLETVEEQLAVFDTLPEIEQVEILRDTLENRHQFKQMFNELLAAYLKRELGTLLQLSHKYGPSNSEIAQRMEERLINKRNRLMVDRMNPILKQGNAFIAIGALHLPGQKGVLNLLKQRGFQVTTVY